MKNQRYDVLIIGGGIIGTMIHYYLQKKNKNILQIEKNNYLADETTQGNSGVLHGGFDAEHPVEAELNVKGTKLWEEEIFPHFKEIPKIKINSLVVAFNELEEKEVEALYKRGIKNNLDPKDIKIISKKEIIEIEPYINKNVTKALLCTSSYAVDPVVATNEIARKVAKSSKILKATEATNITRKKDGYQVELNHKLIIETKKIINAAGHYAAKISKMAKEGNYKTFTRRGEYRVLSKSESSKINNVVFKVPTIFGKGVIVAPMLDGRVLVGPTAEENVPVEDTRLVTLEKWKLIGKIGKNLIPSLDLSKTERTFSGSRSIYKKTNDFLIDYGKNKEFINLIGIKSPGLSSAPSIAKKVVKMILN